MEYPYTINDIRAVVKVSQQSLYNLIKKNKSYFQDNSTKKQRKIYYSQAAMDFFISYYQPEQYSETKENPCIEKPHEEEGREEIQLSALKAQIDALHAQIDLLQKQLDAKEAERVELLRQNGILCLTLQQEKAEKMLLLPSPKKTLGEKVKSLFHKDAHNPEK